MYRILILCLIASAANAQEATFIPEAKEYSTTFVPPLSVVQSYQQPVQTVYQQPVYQQPVQRVYQQPVQRVYQQPVQQVPSALRVANQMRARRGLPPFQYDSRLQASVNSKAQIQANRGAMFHPGGGFGPGAAGEGVGMTHSANQFLTCYLYDSYSHAAAATVRGRNGRYYHALQVSGGGGGGSVRQAVRQVRQVRQVFSSVGQRFGNFANLRRRRN